MKEARALRVSLGPSRLASALICISCLATAALVAWLAGAAALRAAWVIGLGAYAIRKMRHWAMRSASRAIVAIELDLDRAVCLTERNGRRIEGALQADSYVGALITTVVVRPEGKRLLRSTAILPDMLPAEDFRRLPVLLRLGTAQLRRQKRSLRVLQPARAIDDAAAFALRLAADEIQVQWQENVGRGEPRDVVARMRLRPQR
jgi:hypothetical protein